MKAEKYAVEGIFVAIGLWNRDSNIYEPPAVVRFKPFCWFSIRRLEFFLILDTKYEVGFCYWVVDVINRCVVHVARMAYMGFCLGWNFFGCWVGISGVELLLVWAMEDRVYLKISAKWLILSFWQFLIVGIQFFWVFWVLLDLFSNISGEEFFIIFRCFFCEASLVKFYGIWV